MSRMYDDAVMVRPVRNDRDYEEALLEIGQLMSARPGTPEGDQLEVLTTLVEAFEAENYAIDAPDPIVLIEFAMEQRGAARADLEPLIGPRGRVSEVLSRKRSLTLSMIRNLNEKWGLPTNVLIQPYALSKASTPRVLKPKASRRRQVPKGSRKTRSSLAAHSR